MRHKNPEVKAAVTSARPAVAAEPCRHLPVPKLYFFVTDAHVCEQLAQSRYIKVE